MASNKTAAFLRGAILATRLSDRHRIIAEGGIPPVTYEYQKEKWSMQERFGQYGTASGVDMRKLWPTVEEVEEIKALKMYRKAKEAMSIANEVAEKDKLKYEDKMAEIEKNWKNYEKELKEYENSNAKSKIGTSPEEEAKERRTLQVQAKFGYWIDPSEPRFKQMYQAMEEEEILAAKNLKKDERRARAAKKV
ncbi:growth arrest and DNA-damage-inducible proteins-interacting protein 1 domain-containing protein [Ditylenchus destructor]|uniref:Large ribosomal subunit protein mL64 n=1 Tax=Ditylenchus destructor TaxID=166010 RepID=A0AAD4RAT6_9BILA|nr:growth arrest and DNA-damage-inducible proteins-interacting protein 1 domain-containing protein [Ditylenchus destructor]